VPLPYSWGFIILGDNLAWPSIAVSFRVDLIAPQRGEMSRSDRGGAPSRPKPNRPDRPPAGGDVAQRQSHRSGFFLGQPIRLPVGSSPLARCFSAGMNSLTLFRGNRKSGEALRLRHWTGQRGAALSTHTRYNTTWMADIMFAFHG